MSKGITTLGEELKDREVALVICETFFYLLIISASIIGNSCVLLAVYRNRQLRTIPNYFISALAMSDILLPLSCAPPSVAVVVLGHWPFNQEVCQAQGFFVVILACASLLILTLTAINRFYRIVRTRHYRSFFTKRKTIIMIGLCFFLACLEPIPYLSSGRRYVFHPGKMFCFQTTAVSIPNFLVYLYVGLPTFALSFCYFRVFQKMRTHQKAVQNNLQSVVSISEHVTQRDIKVTRILFIAVIGFLACWTPISIIDFADIFRGEVTFPRLVYFMYLILGNLSGVLNPVVYGVLNKNFRDEYRKIFSFRKRQQRIVNIQETSRKRTTAFV